MTMKLEDIAKEPWGVEVKWAASVDGDDGSYCHLRSFLADHAPQMLALLLEADVALRQFSYGADNYPSDADLEWRKRRDALLARLRKEIEA